jgi:hypothetical protein
MFRDEMRSFPNSSRDSSPADVSGFASTFGKFDSAGEGVIYMIVRVTHPQENEDDVAMVTTPGFGNLIFPILIKASAN